MSHQQKRGKGQGHGGGGGGRLQVTYRRRETLDNLKAPNSPPRKWKDEEEIPLEKERQGEVKVLMRKATQHLQPGKPIAGERTTTLLTNHWQVNIKIPTGLSRYEVDYEVVKDKGKDAEKRVARLSPPGPGKRGGSRSSGGGAGYGNGSGDKSGSGALPRRDIMKKAMTVLVERLREMNPGVGIMTDFSRAIFSNVPLKAVNTVVVLHKELEDEDDTLLEYHLTVRTAALNVDLGFAQDLINGGKKEEMDDPCLIEMKLIYNILMRNLGTANHVGVGRFGLLQKAEPNNENYFGQGLMGWKGASLVVTLGATWKPFINIEIQNSAFLIGQSVLNAIAEVFTRNYNATSTNRCSNEDHKKAADVTKWNDHDYEAVLQVLKSCKVRRVIQGRKFDGNITGICGFGSDRRNPRIAAEIFFDYKGKKTSVEAYFKDVFKMTLTNKLGPVLKLGQRACVPAEFCTIKSGQSINRLLQGNPQRKMLDFCKEDPDVKAKRISDTVEVLQLKNNKLMKDFGISIPVNGQMHRLPDTRILNAPELCYGADANTGQMAVIKPSEGTWDISNTNLRFYQSVGISSWAIVKVGVSRTNNDSLRRFANVLIEEGKARGMSFPPQVILEDIRFDRVRDHAARVLVVQNKFAELRHRFPDPKSSIIVCIIPPKPNEVYGQVKQAAERFNSAGVLTSCIQEKNVLRILEKNDRSVARNVLLKMNAKLGGQNHVPLYSNVLDKVSILKVPTLIIGIDVNHPSLPIQGRPVGYPSFASVTGSLDRTGMPYMCHVQAQARTTANKAIGSAEVIENLDSIVTNMLEQFRVRNINPVSGNPIPPSRIIIFRDGVGETQFPEILQKELTKIRAACQSLNPNYKPPITFIAVQKRHKVRFFVDNNGKAGTQNVSPGTIVDRDIVGTSDFYLSSHKGMLGTSRPTHYQVLWDDSDFTSEEIQYLSYYLCYNFSRCNRSVSYPTPTYYAHYAALRAKELANEGNSYRDWDCSDEEGLKKSLNRLNGNLQRNPELLKAFPMHFI